MDTTTPFCSPQGWTDLFMVVCYLATLAGIVGGVRKGLEHRHHPVRRACAELGLLAGFAFGFWCLESWAHFRTPYYLYSHAFRDLVPRVPFETLCANSGIGFLMELKPKPTACTNFVLSHTHAAVPAATSPSMVDRCLDPSVASGLIPLSVILLEASLTYAALRTARMLRAPAGAQPVLAGLSLVTIDALLDPIVAMGHGCSGAALSAPVPSTGNGLGLWHWYLPQVRADLLDTEHYLAPWFHIPFFNYAAWLGAPIVLVAIANFIRGWLHPTCANALARRRGVPETDVQFLRGRSQLTLLFVIFGVVALILLAAPNRDSSESLQVAMTLGLFLTCIGVFVHQFGSLRVTDTFDPLLVEPVALALALPAAAGLLMGQFVDRPPLMIVAVVAFATGLWLALLPYREAMRRLNDWIGKVDAFVRLHYFGFTALLVLLGASFNKSPPNTGTVVGLLLVAASYHVFAYVSNDICDYELDGHAPLRRDDPLQSGVVERAQAIALVSGTVPVALLTTLHLLGFRQGASAAPFAILVFSFGAMLVYNLFGKRLTLFGRRIRFPLLTDLVQGVAWGSLAIYGATTDISANVSVREGLSRSWLLAAYGTAFIFLINGIHGGLRDLKNDLEHDQSTTAILLGAKLEGGVVRSSRRVQVFAHAVHLFMFGLAVYFLYSRDYVFEAPWLAVGGAGIAVLFSTSLWLLRRVVAIEEPQRERYVTWHVLVLLLPPIYVFTLARDPQVAFKICVNLAFFVPLLLQKDYLDWILKQAYGGGFVRFALSTARNRRRPGSTPPPSDPNVAGIAANPDVDTHARA